MGSSPPPTPKKGEIRFKEIRTPCEYIEDYHPGSYHPVHLGDLFKDGQYKVIRKLGVGSFSTVWLTVDQKQNRFAALKVLDAEASKESKELTILRHLAGSVSTDGGKYVTLLLDHFQHEGPNGVHLCLVLEPMGPSANTMVEELPCFKSQTVDMKIRYPTWMAKSLLRQALQGLAFLHANDVTHGDFQPGNILFTLKDLSSVSENELGQDDSYQYGSISPPVERLDGKVDKWAPKYLAVPQPLDKYADISQDFRIKLSDFGGAFFSSDPPKKIVTPHGLRAPEMIFGGTGNKSLDIWSFGCLVFEFITGRPLFLVPGFYSEEESDDDHLLQLSYILGPLPNHLYSLWTRSSRYFTADRVQFNSFLEEVPEGTDLLSVKGVPLEQFFDNEKPTDMTDNEAKAVKSLLRRILQYDPAKRPMADEILQDPWFMS